MRIHSPDERSDIREFQLASLSTQRVQHFSSSGKIDDFVLGVECVDDGAQARLTVLNMTLTCEN
jgi:hypothetical protein